MTSQVAVAIFFTALVPLTVNIGIYTTSTVTVNLFGTPYIMDVYGYSIQRWYFCDANTFGFECSEDVKVLYLGKICFYHGGDLLERMCHEYQISKCYQDFCRYFNFCIPSNPEIRCIILNRVFYTTSLMKQCTSPCPYTPFPTIELGSNSTSYSVNYTQESTVTPTTLNTAELDQITNSTEINNLSNISLSSTSYYTRPNMVTSMTPGITKSGHTRLLTDSNNLPTILGTGCSLFVLLIIINVTVLVWRRRHHHGNSVREVQEYFSMSGSVLGINGIDDRTLPSQRVRRAHPLPEKPNECESILDDSTGIYASIDDHSSGQNDGILKSGIPENVDGSSRTDEQEEPIFTSTDGGLNISLSGIYDSVRSTADTSNPPFVGYDKLLQQTQENKLSSSSTLEIPIISFPPEHFSSTKQTKLKILQVSSNTGSLLQHEDNSTTMEIKLPHAHDNSSTRCSQLQTDNLEVTEAKLLYNHTSSTGYTSPVSQVGSVREAKITSPDAHHQSNLKSVESLEMFEIRSPLSSDRSYAYPLQQNIAADNLDCSVVYYSTQYVHNLTEKTYLTSPIDHYYSYIHCIRQHTDNVKETTVQSPHTPHSSTTDSTQQHIDNLEETCVKSPHLPHSSTTDSTQQHIDSIEVTDVKTPHTPHSSTPYCIKQHTGSLEETDVKSPNTPGSSTTESTQQHNDNI